MALIPHKTSIKKPKHIPKFIKSFQIQKILHDIYIKGFILFFPRLNWNMFEEVLSFLPHQWNFKMFTLSLLANRTIYFWGNLFECLVFELFINIKPNTLLKLCERNKRKDSSENLAIYLTFFLLNSASYHQPSFFFHGYFFNIFVASLWSTNNSENIFPTSDFFFLLSLFLFILHENYVFRIFYVK